MAAEGSFSEEEFKSEQTKLLRRALYSQEIAPSKTPRAVLLGGQSGAGKTRLYSEYRKRLSDNVIVINGDEYRSSHPRYYELDEEFGPDAVAYTAKWAGQMVEELVKSLSKLKYNLVIEGTLRTSEVPISSGKLLRERGYRVSLALMAVKPDISLVSCQIRYEQMRIAGTVPRATDPAHHRKIVESIVGNLAVLEDSGMFEGIELFSRSGECLYPLSDDERTAHEVLSQVLFGEWTPEEKRHYQFLQEKLKDLQKQAASNDA